MSLISRGQLGTQAAVALALSCGCEHGGAHGSASGDHEGASANTSAPSSDGSESAEDATSGTGESGDVCVDGPCWDESEIDRVLLAGPTVGDFDGDGLLDVAFTEATAGGGVVVAYQREDHEFQLVAVSQEVDYINHLAAGDFDADGRDDLVTGDGAQISVHFSEGTSFAEGGAFADAGAQTLASLAVLRGPGPHRLLVDVGSVAHVLEVVNGTPIETDAFSFGPAVCPFLDLLALDANGDGLDDVVLPVIAGCEAQPDASTSRLYVALALEGGGFDDAVELASPGSVTAVAAGLLDGDGRNDIVALVPQNGTLRLYPGAETGFATPVDFAAAEFVDGYMSGAGTVRSGVSDALWISGAPSSELVATTGFPEPLAQSLKTVGMLAEARDFDGDGAVDALLVRLDGSSRKLVVAFQHGAQ